LARSNIEEANIFAQLLEKRFHPNPGSDTLPDLSHNNYLDKIPLVTPKEVAEEIRSNLNLKKHLDSILSQVKFSSISKEKIWST
jgi:hypothetical protein